MLTFERFNCFQVLVYYPYAINLPTDQARESKGQFYAANLCKMNSKGEKINVTGCS
jgi:hypothetical protein